MPEKELPGAIRYNVSQYITLPITEVTLDWRVILSSAVDESPNKVFIVAIPNQVVKDYQKIAKDAGLELYSLEAEVFGITKSLIKESNKTICLVDIGVQSSTLNIVDKGFLKRSYSFNFNSNQLSKVFSPSLGSEYGEPEKIKIKEDIITQNEKTDQTSYSLIDPLLTEVKNISDDFFQSEQRQVDEIYLTGGPANLPGLEEYFAKILKKEVYIPNCFSGLLYHKILEGTLLEMSPRFSVAVGVALDGLEI